MADDQDMKRMIKLQEETLKAQKAGNQTKSLIYYIIVTICTFGMYWVYQFTIKQPAKLVVATHKYAIKGTVAVTKLAVKGSVAGARIAKSEYDKREAAKASASSAKRTKKRAKKKA